MKLSNRALAIILCCAVLLTSLPLSLITFADTSTAKEPTIEQVTYNFKFDGTDEYNFYQETDATTGYGPAFTNTTTNTSTFTNGANQPLDSTANLSVNIILGQENAATKVAKLGRTNNGTKHSMSKFVSPDSRIFDDNDYLQSGSFDLCVYNLKVYTGVFVFGQDKDYNYLFRIGPGYDTTGYNGIMHHEQKNERTTDVLDYKLRVKETNWRFLENENAYGRSAWVHYEFYYDDEGYLHLTPTTVNADGTAAFTDTEIVSSTPIPKESRAFAITNSIGNNYYYSEIFFDNVNLTFANEVNEYTFNFDDTDEYNFYHEVDAATGRRPAFTKNYPDSIYTSAFTKVSESCGHASAQYVLGSIGKHSLGKINYVTYLDGSSLSKANDTYSTAADNNNNQIGAFASPDSKVFTQNEYLMSGSFDLGVGKYHQYNAVLLFGQDETKNYMFRIGTGYYADRGLAHKESAVTFETDSAAYNVNENRRFTGQDNVATDNSVWIHYDFYYDAAGYLHLTPTTINSAGDGLVSDTEIVSTNAIPKEYRAFAFTNARNNGNDNAIYFDNVKLKFKHDPYAVVEEEPIFANSKTNEAVRYDFEDHGEDSIGFINNQYENEYLHEKVTATYSTATDAALTGDSSNTVGKISKPTVKENVTDAAQGNIPELFSPADNIVATKYAEGKVLTSGSFDFKTSSTAGLLDRAIIYGMDENNYQLAWFGVRYGNTQFASNATSLPKTEELTTSGYPNAKAFSVKNDTWVHMEFSYSDTGALTIKVTHEDQTYTVTYSSIEVAPENRIFALTRPHSTNGSEFLFDNVILNFTAEDTAADTEGNYQVVRNTNGSSAAAPDGAGEALVATADTLNKYISGVYFPAETKAIAVWVGNNADTFDWANYQISYRKSEIYEKTYKSYGINFAEESDTWKYHILSTDTESTHSAGTNIQSVDTLGITAPDESFKSANSGYIVIPLDNLSEADKALFTDATADIKISVKEAEGNTFYFDKVLAITDLDAFYTDLDISEIKDTTGVVANSQNWKLGEMSATTGFDKPETYYAENKQIVNFTAFNGASKYLVNLYSLNGKLLNTVEVAADATELTAEFDGVVVGTGYINQVIALDSNGNDIAASEIITSKYEATVSDVIGLINAIGEVKLFVSDQAIIDAKTAYDSLTEEQQGYVYNSDVLFAAVVEYERNTAIATPLIKDVTVDYTADNEIVYHSTTSTETLVGFTLIEKGIEIVDGNKLSSTDATVLAAANTTFEYTVTDADTRYSAKAYAIWQNTEDTSKQYTVYSNNTEGIIVDGVITSSYNDIIRADATLLINYDTLYNQSNNIALVGGNSGDTQQYNISALKTFVTDNVETLNELTAENVNVSLGDSYVKLLGRYHIEDNKSVGFEDSNSGFTFKFVGGGDIISNITVTNLAGGNCWFKIFINGVETSDIELKTDETVYTLAENLPYGEYEITAVKRYMVDRITVSDVKLAAGSYLLGTTPDKQYKIEFIGDSITAGYGNLSTAWSTENCDSTQTFSWYLAEQYNADIICRAYAGQGLAWDFSGKTSGSIVPCYTKTFGTNLTYNGETLNYDWDFENNQVDLVCINLGTNDAQGFNETNTEAIWIEQAKAFLNTVREKYPDAKILWSYGVMGDTMAGTIEAAINEYNREKGLTVDNRVEYFTYSKSYTLANGSHPSAAQSYEIAEEMKPYIDKLLLGNDYKLYGDANNDEVTDIRDLVAMKLHKNDSTYSIKGENLDGSDNDSKLVNIRKDLLDLAVEDTITEYRITYKNLFGAKHNNAEMYSVTSTDTINLSAPLSNREGYTFDGWLDKDGNKVTSLSNLKENVVLTARWLANDINVPENLVDGDIRVMSYNFLAQSYGGRLIFDRADAVLAQIEAYMPDVIGVQEADGTGWATQLEGRTDTYKFIHFVGDTTYENSRWTKIMYNSQRLNVIKSGWQQMTVNDGASGRLFVWAIFEVKDTGKQFLFVNSHWGLQESYRAKQAAEMAEFTTALAKENNIDYIFTTGDFNCCTDGRYCYGAEKPAVDIYLENAGFSDAGLTEGIEKGTLMATYHAWIETSPKQTPFAYEEHTAEKCKEELGVSCEIEGAIDHITYNPSNVTPKYFTVVYNKLAWETSDHLPIFATFDLK